MNKSYLSCFGLGVGACLAMTSAAGDMDRPSGIKIGQRLTLRPYVALSATYDSNVGSRRNGGGDEDVVWTVNPNLMLDYRSDSVSVKLGGYYNYRAYTKDHESVSESDMHSFGQNLSVLWSNSSGNEPGWSLLLTESYRQIKSADDFANGYTGYNNDSRQFNIGGAAQRRFNEHWHGDVNASYYWLDYTDSGSGLSYYGWQRWTAGAEVGFAPSKWTDIILAGGYQGYEQENAKNSKSVLGRDISRNSEGWTVQGGLGSFATERISYRVLAGWSRFEYGEGATSANGFTYTVSGNWKIGETWNMMLLGSSYYQPSERDYATASRVDALSWGLAKGLVRRKLRATLDLTYRHETNERVGRSSTDYDIDMVTGRIGLDYTLNRYLTFFTSAEYIRSFNDAGDRMSGIYDYDRWRLSVGMRFTY